MQKFKALLCVMVAALVVITGCKNGSSLTKAEVEKMIKDAQQNNITPAPDPGNPNPSPTPTPQNGKEPSISEILETALTQVTGKTWTTDRNKTDASGGREDAGFDHEITFDKENFSFAISMKDGGVKSENETVNEDFMEYVKTGVAELKDGKLIFKNRMYIKGIFLPKLTKWLSLDGREWDNSPITSDGKVPGSPDNGGTKTDDPFNEYFKDGMHEGYPNIVLDVELEVKGTGSGRFRNVENVATVDKLRLIIKNGKLQLKNMVEKIEESASTPLNYSYLQRLFFNYYGDISKTFGCGQWPEAKKDDGKYDADPTSFKSAFDALKNTIKDTNKRKQPTKPNKWGYAQDAFTEGGDIDLVFDSAKILAVEAVHMPNPSFNPDLPEDPITNPKEIYGQASLPPLYTTAFPEPKNKDKAYPSWTSGDTLITTALTHAIGGQNPWEVKDFEKPQTVSWNILYGTNTAGEENSLPATLTVTRTVSKVKVTEEDEATIKTKQYPSKAYNDGVDDTPETFDASDHNHYKLVNHSGKLKQYKVSYTVNLKFNNTAETALEKIWPNKTIVGKEFELTYNAVGDTDIADHNFDWVYSLNEFEVMEQKPVKEEWLEFNSIVVYGDVSLVKPDGTTEVVSTNQPLKLRTEMSGDNVLNKQTHFFLPTTLEGNKFISKITKVHIIPKHENVEFTLNAAGFLFDGGVASETWEARINKDDQTEIDVNDPTGVKDFNIQAGKLTNNGGNMSGMQGASMTITLVGLDKNANPKRAGKNRGPSNKKTNWKGYSFVLHIGR